VRRPRFIALQARHATGPLGRLIAWIMALETRRDNLRAIEALDVQSLDHVLDIGAGPGRALARLAALAPAGCVTGIDPSELMVEIASARNASLAHARRVRVVKADAADLPFPDGTFDKAMAVHVLYFWPSLGASLVEIARVLKPGGRLALVFRSASDGRAVAGFPADIYRFPTLQELKALLQRADMSIESIEDNDGTTKSRPVLVVARRSSMPL
jgi:SAM-dependent methyltransferase